MLIVFLYEFNVQMFYKKLEFTNDQIRKYVLANNKFLGIIVAVQSVFVFKWAYILPVSWIGII